MRILKIQQKNSFILLKITSILLLILLWTGFQNIDYTVSYYNDTEISESNLLEAGSINISLDNPDTFSSDLLYPGDDTSTSIEISNSGNLDYKYSVNTELLGLDSLACNYVTMTAISTSTTYTGPIADFNAATASTVETDWNYAFIVDSNTPASVWGKTCHFKWTYTAWQAELLDSSIGFSSVKEKLGSVRIGKAVVLNEILPNPIGLDTVSMPGGEWVELYNNSNQNIDLAGWVIYDNEDGNELYITASNTNTGGTIIGNHGFLVVYKNGDADFNLNNDSDSVRLATGYPASSGTIVDSYTYTAEKPEGFSYARIPDGIGDWVDPIPTPGTSNINGEIVEPILPEATSTDLVIAASTTEETVSGDDTATTKEEIIDEVTATTTASTTEETVTEDDTATTTEEVADEDTASTTEEIISESDASTEIDEDKVVESDIEETVIVPDKQQPPRPPTEKPVIVPEDITNLSTDNITACKYE